MIVYSGVKSDFMQCVLDDSIAITIEKNILEKMGKHTPKSEFKSWENSLEYMFKVLTDEEIPNDAGVAIEYNIPQTSKRIDFLISGYDEKDRPGITIVELKQWEDMNSVKGVDALVETYLGGGIRRVVHPSYQAWSYAQLIRDYNATVQDEDISISPCVCMHNYIRSENDPVDLPGIPEGVEVAGLVLVDVHGIDDHLADAHARVVEIQKHLGLILVALSRDFAHKGEMLRRDGPETGLGVGDAAAAGQLHHGAGYGVAEAAAEGDLLQGEVPHPQPHLVGIGDHGLGAFFHVGAPVLVVPVHGDHAVDVRPVPKTPGKGGLHGPALALVHLMGQHGDLRVLCRLPEGGEMVGVAAVVDEDDVGKALGQEPLHHLHQLFIRIQGGDDNGNVHKNSAFCQIRATQSC